MPNDNWGTMKIDTKFLKSLLLNQKEHKKPMKSAAEAAIPPVPKAINTDWMADIKPINYTSLAINDKMADIILHAFAYSTPAKKNVDTRNSIIEVLKYDHPSVYKKYEVMLSTKYWNGDTSSTMWFEASNKTKNTSIQHQYVEKLEVTSNCNDLFSYKTRFNSVVPGTMKGKIYSNQTGDLLDEFTVNKNNEVICFGNLEPLAEGQFHPQYGTLELFWKKQKPAHHLIIDYMYTIPKAQNPIPTDYGTWTSTSDLDIFYNSQYVQNEILQMCPPPINLSNVENTHIFAISKTPILAGTFTGTIYYDTDVLGEFGVDSLGTGYFSKTPKHPFEIALNNSTGVLVIVWPKGKIYNDIRIVASYEYGI